MNIEPYNGTKMTYTEKEFMELLGLDPLMNIIISVDHSIYNERIVIITRPVSLDEQPL